MYHQLARAIEDAIRSGALAVGSLLGSEIGLAARLGLSRPTVRKAIAELVDAGVVVRQQGVGTRVVSSDIDRPAELTSLFEDLRMHGMKPTTQVLELTRVEPNAELVAEFGFSEPLWQIRRLRCTDAGPLALLDNWVPASVRTITADSLTEQGLYPLLRAARIDLRVARQRIGARNAEAGEAQLLGVAAGAACLTIHRTSFDAGGRLIEVGSHLYRGDSYWIASTMVAH
jgi:DNA-binding GntR family transcriptional regulator